MINKSVNFGIKVADDILFLYSANGADTYKKDFATAIYKSQGYWNDPHYCARIILDSLIGKQQGTQEGFGIYINEIGPNSQDIHVFSPGGRCIFIFNEEYIENEKYKGIKWYGHKEDIVVDEYIKGISLDGF